MKKSSENIEHFRFEGQLKKINSEDLSQHASGIVLLGLASDQGIHAVGGRPGARFAPAVIREKLARLVCQLPKPVYDLGDIISQATIEDTHTAARTTIRKIHEAGHLPIILGGGHDLAFPEARALLDATKGSLGFLNVDAHLDLRPTDKGITSGSPWFLLAKDPDFKKRSCSLVEFGIQDHCNSPQLWEIAKEHKVKIARLEDLRKKQSCVNEFRKTLTALTKKHKAVQVSLDIDSVQASQAPGCSAPQVLGFTAEEFIRYSEIAGSNPGVRSFGIFEVSPPLDFDAHTSRLAAQAVLAFIQGVGARKSRL